MGFEVNLYSFFFFMLFFFFDELLLLGFICGGLFYGIFKKSWGTTYQETLSLKKTTLLLLRSSLVVLMLSLLVNIYQLFSPFPEFSYFDHFFVQLGSTWTTIFGNFFFRKDFYSLFSSALMSVLALGYLFFLGTNLEQTRSSIRYIPEVSLVVVMIVFGLKIFLITFDLLLVIIALELVAFSTIIFMSMQLTACRFNVFPLEAAIKYLIFNGLSIIFLFIACHGYYNLVGSFNLMDIAVSYGISNNVFPLFPEQILISHFFFFFSYMWKLGLAPLHQWVPDVYEGVELLVTALLVLLVGPALLLKFYVFFKLLLPSFTPHYVIKKIIMLFSLTSIIIGTINAFGQYRLKRFLAFTGISHLGFISLGLSLGTTLGLFSSFFYFVLYLLTNFGLFGILILIRQQKQKIYLFLSEIKMLILQNPTFSFFFLIPLFSYAGFPPFGGFFSKLFIFIALIDSQKIHIILLLIIFIILSAYLYLRFIKMIMLESSHYSLFLPVKYYKRITLALTTEEPLKNDSIDSKETLNVFKGLSLLYWINFILIGCSLIVPLLNLICFHAIFCLLLNY